MKIAKHHVSMPPKMEHFSYPLKRGKIVMGNFSFFWGTIILSAATMFSHLGCSSGIKVVFRNLSEISLENVEIRYRGGSYDSGRISPKGSFRVSIAPEGESGLTVTVTDTNKIARVSKNLNIYIEPGYRGNVEIELLKDMTIKQSVKISAWPK